MNANRFDRLTRALVVHASRRRVLSSLSGTLAAVLAAHLRGEEAAAKCVHLGGKCDKKNRKKDKCCGGGKCKGKECKCTNGRVRCGKTCCASGQICGDGECLTGQGNCLSGADSCFGVSFACNVSATCVCFQSTEGETRCGQPKFPETDCGNCTSSAQCAADFPDTPGIFCAFDTIGPTGCGCKAGQGACVAPCPD